MRDVAELTKTGLVVDDAFDPEAWFETVKGHEGSRCERCIGMRLERAAREAAAQGCDVFSTSLSVSPWQDQEAIRVCGEAAGHTHGIEFVYEDLRGEYPASQRLSLERGIYRQRYCGCLVSEWERYRDR
jgi:predicted adenine nucleotide alpha hydrolase (AANH) superfamily ATPase